MKRLAPVAVTLLLLAMASMSGLWQQYQQFLLAPLNIDTDGFVLNVERGASIRAVVAELERRGATRMGWQWRLLSRLEPLVIKAGEYAVPPGLNALDLLKILAAGKVISYRFTIIEGWNLNQLLSEFGKNPVLLHSIQTSAELKGREGFRAGNLEGWFLPETYVFERGGSDLQILQMAYTAMQKALANAWAGRDDGLPYAGPEELLSMASIIEKETAHEGERAAIAGVFVRRLQKHWRLEADPTVIYGMGEAFTGNIRRSDLKRDSAYNTYTRYGLPPTPIALPGVAALYAAAHPAMGEAMFFVANGQGGHTFSDTLKQHNQAVRRLLEHKQ